MERDIDQWNTNAKEEEKPRTQKVYKLFILEQIHDHDELVKWLNHNEVQSMQQSSEGVGFNQTEGSYCLNKLMKTRSYFISYAYVFV